MKIAVITDTHWGVRADSTSFHEYFKLFYRECFFKYIDDNEITTVIHCGDVVDRRKYININTARVMRQAFFEEAEKRGLDLKIILGNHDTFYKTTNKVNALSELCGQYKNVELISGPKEYEFDGLKIAMIPWICADNKEETVEFIRNTSAPIAMGHLELAGFAMYKGVPNAHGEDPKLFGNFEAVYSGHYHHRSSAGNIHYLGAPLEYTWSDYDDPRGFHVFDTVTREATFVQNPFAMFKKIFYDDSEKTLDDLLAYDFEQYRNTIVKVVVKNKSNPYWFDQFIDGLEACGPHDLQVVEDHLNLDLEDDDEIVSEAEDTLTIFRKVIDQIPMNSVDKGDLTQFIDSLYHEALMVEIV